MTPITFSCDATLCILSNCDMVKGRSLRQAKLGRGGDDVRSTIETFRWNPAGIQSRLGELGQHPEASLASCRGDPPGEA